MRIMTKNYLKTINNSPKNNNNLVLMQNNSKQDNFKDIKANRY